MIRSFLVQYCTLLFVHNFCCLLIIYLLPTGKVYAWGFGENLQLGTGEEDDEYEPKEVTGKQLEGRKVLAISAGGQHTCLLATRPQV